ncbi:hypothetical protein TNCV_3973021 [Trichonephila clavipes]|nr:hypothetical protein TNCV_3973021 [Trichonephila clavipes]
MVALQESSPKLNSLEGEFFSDPPGLTWEHDILVLKPSPCLPNGSQRLLLANLDTATEPWSSDKGDSRAGTSSSNYHATGGRSATMDLTCISSSTRCRQW